MRQRNNKGFSLVELAIGLAVVTILILAISMSSGIRDTARMQAAADSVQSLRSAAESYLASGNVSYTGVDITKLKGQNLLPANFSGTSTNPWGGNYTVGPNPSDATKFDIALTKVSSTDNTKLISFFSNVANTTAYDSASKTWTVTF